MADETTQTMEPRRRKVEEKPVVGLVAVFSQSIDTLPLPFALRSAVRIGREAGCDLVLDDPKVSREHTLIGPEDRSLRVRDLGSRNGTFVNGQQLGTEPVEVAVGSTIRVGNTLLRVVSDINRHRTGVLRVAGLVGAAGLNRVRQQITEIARSSSPVLIAGESGTGKERVAEAIHLASERRGEYVTLNCAAMPSDLIESELFGHTKGAFSGSDRARPGLFRAAEGGTLLLDEIGELPLPAQAKLLRVLENGEVRPVGEDRPTQVDVRVLAATNRDLMEMVDQGTFRNDLYHRIVADVIVIPPLRQRLEDVPGLALFFLETTGVGLSTDAVEKFLLYSWPGNVRELRNVVSAAAVKAKARESDRIEIEHLPTSVCAAKAVPTSPSEDPDRELRTRLETALRLRNGNVSQVARDLNMRRAGVYEHLKRMDIDPASFRES